MCLVWFIIVQFVMAMHAGVQSDCNLIEPKTCSPGKATKKHSAPSSNVTGMGKHSSPEFHFRGK